ncbi:nitroreductase [Clostridium sp. cel8]|jgi:nitroreductase|uniref:nitroreductase n=1 Tax=Clostridium sp. cel8 TaxID=2663123 RepID=UPI0015F4D32E|nr:nitroreductase [Clostridium sp. cel8]MBA5850542.1 nitroreductase [Clostridium sp. cel8]
MKETLIDLKTRRSCRKYKSQQIKKEELDAILEAGTYAPTSMGKQSPIIVAIQDKATIDKISKLNAAVMGTDSDPFYGAPTLVVVFTNKDRATYIEDGALAIGNMLNAAHALGVGSCYIYRARESFDTKEGRAFMKKWGLPDNYVGVGNCILGYAEDGGIQEAAPRKKDYIIKV